MEIKIRVLTVAEIPAVAELVAASVRGLQGGEYGERERDAALRTVFTVDTRLVADGGYFGAFDGDKLLGCGGWSGRKTLYGGDHQVEALEPEWMDPEVDAAKIRAIFVHPSIARRGVGRMLLRAAEDGARRANFRSFEMGSTLTGVALYSREGYFEVGRMMVPVGEGLSIEVVRMVKDATGAA